MTEGVAAVARHLLAAQEPAIMIGDDVARAGAGEALVALAETVGAGIWTELIHQHQPVPNRHPNYRGRIPSDPANIAQAFGGADLVLMVGGPFFEEVWYAPEGPFPPGAAVLQIEESAERLGRNHGLDAGLIAGLKPALEAVTTLVQEERLGRLRRRGPEERNRVFVSFAGRSGRTGRPASRPSPPARPMPVPVMMEALAGAVPEDVVIVEEAITGSQEIPKAFSFGGAGDYFCGRGGGIGQGIAGALGVKLANPGSSGGLPLRRRLCNVQHPGALDRGAPPTPDRLHHPRQRRVPHSQAQPRHLPEALRRADEPPLRADGPGRSAPSASSRWRPAWASPAPASPSPTRWPRRLQDALASGAPHLIEAAVEGKV